MSLFHHFRAVSEIFHDDDLDTPDVPVKIELEDGRELVVTDAELQTNPETGEQIVWLEVKEDI
jgi:hypothetical protein